MSKRLFIRQLAIYSSLIVYLFIIALVLSSLLSEFWIETQQLKRNNEESPLSYASSGLFSGIRQLDWGHGPRKQYFSVIDEIHRDVSFISKQTFLFMMFFIALGLLWTFIGFIVALLNSIMNEISTIVGPEGFYLWSTLAFFCYMISTALFTHQFTTTIVNNVLLPEQLEAGFSSVGLARFGVSFYLFNAGALLLFVPCILIFITTKHGEKQEKTVEFDQTVLMY